ncbi:hybrid sensor histidine kinase/response regulator [Acaryochloris sp. IP29b_bin.148]|uniref:hybrid sensor histidine kinase/response regulator n=1 Tax=Acaryochloris sp. IP29b_bin.148 TaxID=2969218 RepID=UPI0026120B34|nr:hybrid sensor histidine kinase/response regulator [Acaryochloris sp. IP29b_bin.148]
MSKPVIVCVDDETAVLDSLRRELSETFEESCDIETAVGGLDAITLVQELVQEQCDLPVIIADYLMPDIKGDEVLQRVHQLSPQTLTIMLTGQASVDGITHAINTAQLYHYIAKPWHPADLQLTVREALNSYQREQQIVEYQQTLERKVQERTQTLTQTLHELEATQSELIRSEKMAALGQLVAGVAHEINTPVGNAILAASVLNSETTTFYQTYQDGALKRSTLGNYVDIAHESSDLILQNLKGAAALIQNFKQVAVDQTSHEKRRFQIIPYIESVLTNLEPKLKQTSHTVTVSGDAALKTINYPGALSQVVTNLVMNSILHAYQPGEAGQLQFDLTQQQNRLILLYTDDGCGIPIEHQSKIFEPFFTTGRDRGGSGLGLHIAHNLVTQTLQGNLHCQSTPTEGTRFILNLPLNLENDATYV